MSRTSPDSDNKFTSRDASLDKMKLEGATSHVEQSDPSSNREFDDSIEDTEPSRAVWLITFTVAMGGFLFGYDTGVISAVLVSLKDDLGHELDSHEQELITSITSGGALLGALIAGLPADRYGRKLGIYLGCLLFLIGTIIQAAAFSVAQMTVGRLVVGLGVGSAAMIIPLYIGELAPAKHRGRMIAFDNMSVTFGQLVSYALGAGFTEVPHGWRYMVAVGGVPPIVLAFLLPKCPESPRQLISHGKLEEAARVIKRVYPHATEEQVAAKVGHMAYTVEVEAQVTSGSLWDRFKELHVVPSNFRALVCACAIMAISQLGGFNTLMYYSATLFGLVGFNKPVAVSIVVGATNFVFSLVNLFVIDRVGRRRILLITVAGMVSPVPPVPSVLIHNSTVQLLTTPVFDQSASMVVAAVAFHWIPVSPDLKLQTASVNWAGILVLVTIIVYVACFAGGVATIAWVGTELLPLEVRALGTMMNTVVCWGCNIIIASTFLSMMKGMTPSGAFGFYAGICFFGWIFCIFCYPEANGLPLEDVRQIFATGFGVKKANELQRLRKMTGGSA
ncbi:myo-inositol transporter [Colletotrichum higginsianum]|uniref:Myo-inositol transporter n=1 Tax=Colletotrichum higginsianum (strain IMI 349063) TaxID=759273 RepID=H1V8B1_COLHI|nr:Myo-inositol transporter [Colletotrichum higginsianum IMI 349063]OBR03936.1 Myo-inositol transporter [Colletotrichum higginsianum IMI 349063]CCF36464.1 myo-inositol transporter [Colletotrichum higginsianum]